MKILKKPTSKYDFALADPMTQTIKCILQKLAYRPTVYKTGVTAQPVRQY